jgi:Phage derived protein Gp49-like (DUF891)
MIFGNFPGMPARTQVSNSSRCSSGAIRITGILCQRWELAAGKSGSAPTQFGDEIYVLHCFTKKTQKTSKKDIDIGESSGRGEHQERVG